MKYFLCILSVFAMGATSAIAEEGQELAAQHQTQEHAQSMGKTVDKSTNNATNQAPSRIHWNMNYNDAAAVAKKENKPMLLFFTGSDWCGWCKKMDQEVFSQTEFAKEVGNDFVFVEVDFPMNQQLPPEQAQTNADLKQKYGVTGYPTVIILSSDGNFIAETGYRPGGAKAYAEYLRQLMQ